MHVVIGKSFKTNKDTELIKFNKDYFEINLCFDNTNTIKIKLHKNKEIFFNDVKLKKISDIIGKIPVVIFTPESLEIISGSNQNRRQYFDLLSIKTSKKYLIYLTEYVKLIKFKNNHLKKDVIDRNYIKTINEKLSKLILYIYKYRIEIIKLINNKILNIHSDLTNDKEKINIEYISDFFDKDIEEIEEYLNKYIDIEIARKSSVKGIQKDIFNIYINNINISIYGSQGQKRTTMLSLLFSEMIILEENIGTKPILLLDDIMSELDENRAKLLFKKIKENQCIITTTEEYFNKEIENKIKIFKINEGNIVK